MCGCNKGNPPKPAPTPPPPAPSKPTRPQWPG